MNLLIFSQDNLDKDGHLIVGGEEAAHLIDVKKVCCDDIITVGQLNGLIGSAKVVSIDSCSVTLNVSELLRPSPSCLTDLIIALPRPQILKKVLEISASMGVSRIMLIKTAKVEKSYFLSSALMQENIEKHLRLGLQQAVCTKMPVVSIHKRFKKFIEEDIQEIFQESSKEADSYRLIAHPGAESNLASISEVFSLSSNLRFVLAIGPEGGFDEPEVKAFQKAGFLVFNCGERILRVEHAVSFLLGQLDLLRCMSKTIVHYE